MLIGCELYIVSCRWLKCAVLTFSILSLVILWCEFKERKSTDALEYVCDRLNFEELVGSEGARSRMEGA